MLSKEFTKALLAVCKELNENGIEFVVIGSVNSALQGYFEKPKDIDIVVRFEEVDKALSCLSHFFIEELHTPEKYILRLGVFGVRVEVIGNNNSHSAHAKAFNARKESSLEGERIFILPLEKSIEFYKETGMTEKAKELKMFVDKNK